MALVTAAGITAAGAYLNAKYHIRKDVSTLWNLKAGERAFAKNVKENRISCWYPFEEQVDRLPAKEVCIWSRTGSYTWRETYDNACRYANFMLELGVQPRDYVAFYLTNHAEFLFAFLATFAIGTSAAFQNSNLAGDALIHCLKLSGSKILLVDEDSECISRIEDVRDRIEGEAGMKIVIVDAKMKQHIASLPATRPDNSYRDKTLPSDPFALIYTSGTTGFPKAAPFTIQRIRSTAPKGYEALGISAGPNGGRWYSCMPLYHGTAINAAQLCLLNGITFCVGTKFSGTRFWSDIRDSKATAFVYVGEMCRYLIAQPPSPLDKQHHVTMIFGNGLRPDIWERLKARFGIEYINEFFNSTEGVFGTINVCRGPFFSTAVGHHGGLFRFLLRNTYVPVEIDNETNDIARDPKTGFAIRKSYEEGGEILVAVPDRSAFAGYYKNPSATAKKFATDVFKKGDLYYRSGDALRRDAEGRWHFLDRLGDTFRWKSENVSTAEVAVLLGNYPGIVEANVYGVLVPAHDGRAGCAALYLDPAAREGFDWAALHAHLRQRLPKYAVPVFVRELKQVAPSHNQKQNKVPLRNEGVEPDKVKAGAAGPEDRILWIGLKGEGYVPFKQEDWEMLKAEKAKL